MREKEDTENRLAECGRGFDAVGDGDGGYQHQGEAVFDACREAALQEVLMIDYGTRLSCVSV